MSRTQSRAPHDAEPQESAAPGTLPELPAEAPSAPQPTVTTRYPAGEPALYVAPDFRQVGVDTLLQNSATIQSLIARIVALENAR